MSPRSKTSWVVISPFLSRSRNMSLTEWVAMMVPSKSKNAPVVLPRMPAAISRVKCS